MNSLRLPLLGSILATACALAFSSAPAAPVLVDFSTMVAAPVNQIDTLTGYYWNSITVPQNTVSNISLNLLDSAGAASGLNLSFTSATAMAPNSLGPTTSTLFSSWVAQDYLQMNGDITLTLTLSGLTAGQSYDFIFFGARGNPPSAPASDLIRSALYQVTSGASTGGNTLDATNNVNSTATVTITADLSGIATITMSKAGNNNADWTYLNSLQIVPVPEPGSIALAIFGGGLLLGIGLRKSRSAA